MTTKHLALGLVAVMAVTVGVARARRAPVDADTRTFKAAGVVTAAPADGRITVAHEAIPGYMPAMTMPFAMGKDAPPLSAGDRVRFTLRVDDETARAESIVVTGRDASVAAAAAAGTSARGRLKEGDTLPAFALTREDGQPFTDADLRGRPTAITFIFTRCPMPEFCPLVVKRFQQLQGEIAKDPALKDVRMVSVTLDPAFDTPEVLSAYGAAMKADPARWRFVTGDPAEIGRLTTAFAVHTERNGVTLDHTLATAIVDADGRVAGIWRGNGWKVTELVETLKGEAGRSTGSPARGHGH